MQPAANHRGRSPGGRGLRRMFKAGCWRWLRGDKPAPLFLSFAKRKLKQENDFLRGVSRLQSKGLPRSFPGCRTMTHLPTSGFGSRRAFLAQAGGGFGALALASLLADE